MRNLRTNGPIGKHLYSASLKFTQWYISGYVTGLLRQRRSKGICSLLNCEVSCKKVVQGQFCGRMLSRPAGESRTAT